jgi:cysteinyl-tRNA synthetase
MDGIATLEKVQAASSSTIDVKGLRSKCLEAMNDDFNTPILISHLFEGVKWINLGHTGNEKATAADIEALKSLFADFVFEVLGLRVESEESEQNTALTEGLMELIIKLRKGAKESRDYTTADQIREELSKLGIQLKDSPEGTSFEIR